MFTLMPVACSDEPMSNLDAKLRRRVRDDIRELQQKLDLTVAHVTHDHDQEEALAVSDRIIVMANATIAQSGTPRELYEAPADLFVADLSATPTSSPPNWARGTATGRRSASETSRRACRTAAERPGPVKVAIRSESLRLAIDPPRGPAIRGEIGKAAYLGTHMEYTVVTALGDLFEVDRGVTRPLPPGSPVWIALADHGVTVVPS